MTNQNKSKLEIYADNMLELNEHNRTMLNERLPGLIEEQKRVNLDDFYDTKEAQDISNELELGYDRNMTRESIFKEKTDHADQLIKKGRSAFTDKPEAPHIDAVTESILNEKGYSIGKPVSTPMVSYNRETGANVDFRTATPIIKTDNPNGQYEAQLDALNHGEKSFDKILNNPDITPGIKDFIRHGKDDIIRRRENLVPPKPGGAKFTAPDGTVEHSTTTYNKPESPIPTPAVREKINSVPIKQFERGKPYKLRSDGTPTYNSDWVNLTKDPELEKILDKLPNNGKNFHTGKEGYNIPLASNIIDHQSTEKYQVFRYAQRDTVEGGGREGSYGRSIFIDNDVYNNFTSDEKTAFHNSLEDRFTNDDNWWLKRKEYNGEKYTIGGTPDPNYQTLDISGTPKKKTTPVQPEKQTVEAPPVVNNEPQVTRPIPNVETPTVESPAPKPKNTTSEKATDWSHKHGHTGGGDYWWDSFENKKWRDIETVAKSSGQSIWGENRLYFGAQTPEMREKLGGIFQETADKLNIPLAFKSLDEKNTSSIHINDDLTRTVANFESVEDAAKFNAALLEDSRYKDIVTQSQDLGHILPLPGENAGGIASFSTGYREKYDTHKRWLDGKWENDDYVVKNENGKESRYNRKIAEPAIKTSQDYMDNYNSKINEFKSKVNPQLEVVKPPDEIVPPVSEEKQPPIEQTQVPNPEPPVIQSEIIDEPVSEHHVEPESQQVVERPLDNVKQKQKEADAKVEEVLKGGTPDPPQNNNQSSTSKSSGSTHTEAPPSEYHSINTANTTENTTETGTGKGKSKPTSEEGFGGKYGGIIGLAAVGALALAAMIGSKRRRDEDDSPIRHEQPDEQDTHALHNRARQALDRFHKYKNHSFKRSSFDSDSNRSHGIVGAVAGVTAFGIAGRELFSNMANGENILHKKNMQLLSKSFNTAEAAWGIASGTSKLIRGKNSEERASGVADIVNTTLMPSAATKIVEAAMGKKLGGSVGMEMAQLGVHAALAGVTSFAARHVGMSIDKAGGKGYTNPTMEYKPTPDQNTDAMAAHNSPGDFAMSMVTRDLPLVKKEMNKKLHHLINNGYAY